MITLSLDAQVIQHPGVTFNDHAVLLLFGIQGELYILIPV
jgi:hypothetical protein